MIFKRHEITVRAYHQYDKQMPRNTFNLSFIFHDATYGGQGEN